MDRDRLDVLLEHPDLLKKSERESFDSIREHLDAGGKLSVRQREWIRSRFAELSSKFERAKAPIRAVSPESDRESRVNLEILLGPKVCTPPPSRRRVWE